jgi:hypothetical protein
MGASAIVRRVGIHLARGLTAVVAADAEFDPKPESCAPAMRSSCSGNRKV